VDQGKEYRKRKNIGSFAPRDKPCEKKPKFGALPKPGSGRVQTSHNTGRTNNQGKGGKGKIRGSHSTEQTTKEKCKKIEKKWGTVHTR